MTKQPRSRKTFDPRVNRILARLEREDYDALMLDAKVVPLKFRKRLLRQDERVDAVYFPMNCHDFTAGHYRWPASDGDGYHRERRRCRSIGASPNTRRDGSEPDSDTWHCGADRRRRLPESNHSASSDRAG